MSSDSVPQMKTKRQSPNRTRIHPKTLRRFHPHHHDSNHQHSLHQECNMYITPKSLQSRLITPLPTLVIDSRNPKHYHAVEFTTHTSTATANNRGRLIYRPSSTSTSTSTSTNTSTSTGFYFRSALEAARLRRRQCNGVRISNPRCLIVVCGTGGGNGEGESWTAAARLRREVGSQGEVVVRVLKGGMGAWSRTQCGWNRSLVEVDGWGTGGGRGVRGIGGVEESCGTGDVVERDHLRYQYTCW